jgi:hypothetical protein
MPRSRDGLGWRDGHGLSDGRLPVVKARLCG